MTTHLLMRQAKTDPRYKEIITHLLLREVETDPRFEEIGIHRFTFRGPTGKRMGKHWRVEWSHPVRGIWGRWQVTSTSLSACLQAMLSQGRKRHRGEVRLKIERSPKWARRPQKEVFDAA